MRKKAVKYYWSLNVNFHLSSDQTFLTNPHTVINNNTMEVYMSSEIDNAFNSTYENLASAIKDFQQCGSGWVLNKLFSLDLHLLEFSRLRATSYIPLPQEVRNRKVVINIQSKDEKCFLWSVIAGLDFKNVQLRNYKDHLVTLRE